jgi:hypothetical protein
MAINFCLLFFAIDCIAHNINIKDEIGEPNIPNHYNPCLSSHQTAQTA